MSFAQRQIWVEFSLASGVFSGGGNAATIKGKRVTAKIVNWGGPSMGQLELAIYGLPLSLMNQLTTLGTQINLIGKNTVKVYAGTKGGSMPLIFSGTISIAYMDGQAMPQVPFRVSAFAGLYESVQKIEPTTKEGDVDVAPIFEDLAGKMGLSFENNGVDDKAPSPYLPGSPRDQVMALAHMIGCQWLIDRDTLAIWKTGHPRNGDSVTISPKTGLVTYPAFNQAGVVVTTLFNPNLRPGASVFIQSDVTPANGKWIVISIALDLAAEVSKGPWFATVTTFREGETPP